MKEYGGFYLVEWLLLAVVVLIGLFSLWALVGAVAVMIGGGV